MINPIDDIPIQLAETLVADLNVEFAGTFVSVFDFVPENDIRELKNLKVTVVPGGLESSEIIDRGETTENNWLVGIGFQKKVDRSDHTKTKDALQVVRQVRDYLNQNRIVAIADDEYVIDNIESSPYVDKDLLGSGHFFSALILTFKEWEDLP